MTERARLIQRLALGAIAVLATFGIGILVGREIVRPPVATKAAPAANLVVQPTVPPQLLAYRVLQKIPIDLARPRGIASQQDGTLWVCGDRALISVGRSGAVKARFALDGEPTCVALGPAGKILVGMQDHVEAIDPATGNAASWPDLGSQAIVTSIAAGSSGVYVADAGNKMIMRFDQGGKLIGRIDKGFVVPSPYFDVAAAADGTLWAANPGSHLVQHFTPDGRLLASWGKSSIEVDGFAGCCNPIHLTLLPCGALVTSEKGLLRVKVYEPDGKLNAVVAAPADFPAGETILTLSTRKANGGEILVLAPGERAVRVYVKNGAAVSE
jgi:hypothetical protein